MQNIVKPCLTLLTLLTFLIFAASSFGPDMSSNVGVAISDCKSKPSVHGKLKINVDAAGGQNADLRIYIVHQKVKPDTTCTFDILENVTIEKSTTNGHYSYEGFEFDHNNSEDLIRVELNAFGFGTHEKIVYVKKYNEGTFNFKLTQLPPLP